MGDFKCNSGIPADKTRETAEDKNLYNSNSGSENYPDNNISDNNASTPGYSKNNITDSDDITPGYDRNNITDSDTKSQFSDRNNSTSADSDFAGYTDCGCGAADDMSFPDDDNSAIIYSETVVFTEPYDYDSADSRTNTSDLIEDEQEGSEFNSSDSSRPQC